MSVSTESDKPTPAADQPTQKPDLERVREWKHTDGGLGADCDKSDIPIYAAPTDIPKDCDGRAKTWPNQPCESDSWQGNGIVMRDKNNGKVVIREPKL